MSRSGPLILRHYVGISLKTRPLYPPAPIGGSSGSTNGMEGLENIPAENRTITHCPARSLVTKLTELPRLNYKCLLLLS